MATAKDNGRTNLTAPNAGKSAAAVLTVDASGADTVALTTGRVVSGSYTLRTDRAGYPDGGPTGTENPGVSLGTGAAAVQVGVALSLRAGVKSGLFVVTAFDAATTYTFTVGGVGYDATGEADAEATCDAIAAAINAATTDREDPRAEVVSVTLDGTAYFAVHAYAWGSTVGGAPAMVVVATGAVSGGAGTASVFATPDTVSFRIMARPTVAVATGVYAYEDVDNSGTATAATFNYGQRLNLAGYDRCAVRQTAVTVNASDTGCSALVLVRIAPAAEGAPS